MLLIECVDVRPLGSLAEQNRKPRRSLEAIHVAISAEPRHPHRRASVHHQRCRSKQWRLVLQRAKHCLLKFGLVLGIVARGCNKAKRHHAIRLHFSQSINDQLVADSGLAHIPQVTEQRQCAQLLLTQ